LDPSLEELMRDYAGGDPAAFDRLYRRTAPQLYSYLLRLTRDPHRAEDLLQTTFFKVHRARGSYLLGAPLLPWMFAIARRAFYDEQRSRRVRPEELSDDGALPEPIRPEAEATSPRADAVERALDALPEAYREAIQLTRIAGLSLVEAARVLATTPTAVKLRVHRGYLGIRKRLEGTS
jgi:RNA polymerase sigma factor (sigma-70 family)